MPMTLGGVIGVALQVVAIMKRLGVIGVALQVVAIMKRLGVKAVAMQVVGRGGGKGIERGGVMGTGLQLESAGGRVVVAQTSV